MEIKSMQRHLTDIILDTAKGLQYAYEEPDLLWRDFYSKIEKLYQSDKETFIKTTKYFLMDSVPFLEDEAIQIKMNCAGIWCQDSFCIYIFRIRYYLSIADEGDMICIKRKLRNLYVKSENLYEKRKTYFQFFYSVIQSKSNYDVNIKQLVNQILINDYQEDAECAVFYVALKYAQGEKQKVPNALRNIYLCIVEISEIQIDGLVMWSLQNKIAGLKKLTKALNIIGRMDLSTVLKDYSQYLNDLTYQSNTELCDFLENISSDNMKEITEYELQINRLLQTKDIVSSANEYLTTYNNSV